MLRNALILSFSLTAVVACAVRPPATSPLTGVCHAANADSSEQISIAPPEKLASSNIFKLNYLYPQELRQQHLQGRVLVRLKIGTNGKIDSAEFLKVEAPPQVESAMCDLLQKLQYDVSTPDFNTIDSRTFALGIRYCLGNCNHVPVFPGFEKKEITITGSL